MMGKHRGILEQQAQLLENPDENAREIQRCIGREGAIMGVALEAAAVNLAQRAGNRFAITPASLRSEEGQTTGSDVLLWDSHDLHSLWSAQVKRRVDSHARHKYRRVPLICGIHHMRFTDEPLIETLKAIESGERAPELEQIGRRLVAIMRGSPDHGCTRYNPTFQYQYLRRVRQASHAA